MEALGFDAYLPGLKLFLNKYKEVHKGTGEFKEEEKIN
jgi:hypothetical protein